jgi:signal transduction histidine kinase
LEWLEVRNNPAAGTILSLKGYSNMHQASAAPSRQASFVPLHADSLHDLSGPVNQISTMLELYLKRRPAEGDGAADPLLQLIRESASRLQSLIRALQDYDRVAGAPLAVRPCDTATLLAIAVDNLGATIRESGAEVTQGPLPRVECDPNQIGQVFASLLDNALKFRGETRPEIRVSAERQGEYWLFSVRDNGAGIDARHHEAVFHMFRRINGDRYPGSGVGLALSRHIVERHGGWMWVESELGSGSNFFFTLRDGPWHAAC